jgi:Flp pilus assembly protein TadG
MAMLKKFTSRLRRFGAETDGYITLEAMIVLPGLLWLFAASWVYFDVFRQQSVNQKANYTIGDMISRETNPVDDSYIDNARKLLYLVDKSEGAETDLRVTVVLYNQKKDKYEVVWSESRGAYPELTTANMPDYRQRLPVMANMDQVIVVETWDDYVPAFRGVGLDFFRITTYSFTRPRFTPQILHADMVKGNNGFGNGDQDAPGGSLCNNNAENAGGDGTCANEDGAKNNEPKKKKS